MKRVVLIGVAIVATVGVAATTAASSVAAVRCAVVAEAKTGNYKDAKCESPEAKGEYIKVVVGGVPLGGAIECAVVAEAKTGNYKDAKCENAEAGGEYIKVVKAASVHWNYAGKELASGTKESLTTKIKSAKVVLSVPSIKLELEGTGFSTTEGYIEGTKVDGAKSINLSGFMVKGAPELCTVKSPGQASGNVVTHEVKTFLHEISTSEIDDAVTPSGKKATGEEIVTLEIGGAECAIAQTSKLTGSIVGRFETPNAEAASQSLNCPSPALKLTEGSETFGTLLWGAKEAILTVEATETAAEKFGAYA